MVTKKGKNKKASNKCYVCGRKAFVFNPPTGLSFCFTHFQQAGGDISKVNTNPLPVGAIVQAGKTVAPHIGKAVGSAVKGALKKGKKNPKTLKAIHSEIKLFLRNMLISKHTSMAMGGSARMDAATKNSQQNAYGAIMTLTGDETIDFHDKYPESFNLMLKDIKSWTKKEIVKSYKELGLTFSKGFGVPPNKKAQANPKCNHFEKAYDPKSTLKWETIGSMKELTCQECGEVIESGNAQANPETTKYFKAILERNGKTKTVYGMAFTDMGQTPRKEAIHIGLVQGFGKSKIKSIKTFKSGDEWYKAQYGVYPHEMQKKPQANPMPGKKPKLKIEYWSPMMQYEGQPDIGTIRTVPGNHYVASIMKDGKIQFDDVTNVTKDVDKKYVRTWYYKHKDDPKPIPHIVNGWRLTENRRIGNNVSIIFKKGNLSLQLFKDAMWGNTTNMNVIIYDANQKSIMSALGKLDLRSIHTEYLNTEKEAFDFAESYMKGNGKALANPKFGKGSYYQQLKPVVLGYLEGYKEDFTKHDKKQLRNVKEFIHSMRKTGTDLIILDIMKKDVEDYGKETILSSYDAFHNRNNRYFYGKDGKVTEITRDKANSIIRNKVDEIIHKYPKLAPPYDGKWYGIRYKTYAGWDFEPGLKYRYKDYVEKLAKEYNESKLSHQPTAQVYEFGKEFVTNPSFFKLKGKGRKAYAKGVIPSEIENQEPYKSILHRYLKQYGAEGRNIFYAWLRGIKPLQPVPPAEREKKNLTIKDLHKYSESQLKKKGYTFKKVRYDNHNYWEISHNGKPWGEAPFYSKDEAIEEVNAYVVGIQEFKKNPEGMYGKCLNCGHFLGFITVDSPEYIRCPACGKGKYDFAPADPSQYETPEPPAIKVHDPIQAREFPETPPAFPQIDDKYYMEMNRASAYLNPTNINPKTFKGTWEQIKKYILKNFDKYTYIIFYEPGTKKEMAIIPSKTTKNWIKKAKVTDLKRVAVRNPLPLIPVAMAVAPVAIEGAKQAGEHIGKMMKKKGKKEEAKKNAMIETSGMRVQNAVNMASAKPNPKAKVNPSQGWQGFLDAIGKAWDANRHNLKEIYLNTAEMQRRLCRETGFAMNDFTDADHRDVWNFLVKQCLLSGKQILINAKDCFKEAKSQLRASANPKSKSKKKPTYPFVITYFDPGMGVVKQKLSTIKFKNPSIDWSHAVKREYVEENPKKKFALNPKHNENPLHNERFNRFAINNPPQMFEANPAKQADINKAIKKFKQFHQYKHGKQRMIKVPKPEVLFKVGDFKAVGYGSPKWDKKYKHYIHEFEKGKSKGGICAYDPVNQMLICWTPVKSTARGIEDLTN